jgi:hypothetical protein
MQPIVPPVYRTGNPDLDRNFDAIAAAFRRLDLGSGDHLVIVDKSDTPDTAENKVVQGTGVTIEKTGKAGDRQLTVSADPAGIVNEITNNETLVENISNSLTTNQTFITNVTNVIEVNATTPAQVAARLYPTEVKSPLDRGPCWAAVDLHRSTSSIGWNQVDGQPGVYQRSTIGALTADDLDGLTPVVTPAGCDLVGKRFINIDTQVINPSTYRDGPMVLDDVGDRLVPNVPGGTTYHHEYSYARFHRAPGYTLPSQFVQGMTFQVLHGTLYGGKYFTLETAQPIDLSESGTPQNWTMGTSNPNTDTYHALLNIAQCQQLGASTDTQTVTDNFLAGGTNDFQFGWTTHTRGLNRTTLTAGIYSVSALVQIQPSVIGSITQLLAHLSVYHVDDSVSSPFMILTSSPIDNTRPFGSEVITFQALLVADVPIAETDELQLEFFGHTDSSVDPIFITLTLQAPNRPTFIEVPFQMSITGVATGAHDQLDHRNFTKQHPNCSSYPVLSTSASVGWIWLGNGPANDRGVSDRSDYVRVTLQGDTYGDGVYGIKPTWQDGTEIPDGFLVGVYIANATPSTPKKAVSGATPPTGSGFLPLANDALPNGAGKQHTFNGPTELVYRLDLTEQRWRIVSFQTYSVVTS